MRLIEFLALVLTALPGVATGTQVSSPSSIVRPDCPRILTDRGESPATLADPMRAMFYWAQTQNDPYFEKPSAPVQMRLTKARIDQVRVRTIESPDVDVIDLSKIEDPVLATGLSQFMRGGVFFYPQHPLNTYDGLPFFKEPLMGTMDAFYSGSRSMFVVIGGRLYQIKLPTSVVNPNFGERGGKWSLKDSLELALARSRHVRSQDKLLGPSEVLISITEIASFADKASGNGGLIRDMTPLQDGHYYLWAYAIPYIGRQIAEKLGIDFEGLWGKYYAETVGVAKAELMLRYGLQMYNPHAQNWVIQLDSNYMPTGKIVAIDFEDSAFVPDLAMAMGFNAEVQRDFKANERIMSNLDPIIGKAGIANGHSFQNMETAGVSPETISRWNDRQSKAYGEWLNKKLGLNPADFPHYSRVDQFLKTNPGQELLKMRSAALRAPKN